MKTFLQNYRNASLENTCVSVNKHNYHSFPLSHKPQGVHFKLTYTFLTVCKLPFITTPDSIVLQIRENCFFSPKLTIDSVCLFCNHRQKIEPNYLLLFKKNACNMLHNGKSKSVVLYGTIRFRDVSLHKFDFTRDH